MFKKMFLLSHRCFYNYGCDVTVHVTITTKRENETGQPSLLRLSADRFIGDCVGIMTIIHGAVLCFTTPSVLLPAGLRVAQPCRYCFFSLAQKWVFRPAGATRCPDKRESWHGVPTFTFIGAKMW